MHLEGGASDPASCASPPSAKSPRSSRRRRSRTQDGDLAPLPSPPPWPCPAAQLKCSGRTQALPRSSTRCTRAADSRRMGASPGGTLRAVERGLTGETSPMTGGCSAESPTPCCPLTPGPTPCESPDVSASPVGETRKQRERHVSVLGNGEALVPTETRPGLG